MKPPLFKRVFELRFPSLAQHVRKCEAALKRLGYPDEIAKPRYGLWYNYCINAGRKNLTGVSTMPHVDSKNLAIMMCCVFVYGM